MAAILSRGGGGWGELKPEQKCVIVDLISGLAPYRRQVIIT